MKITEKQALDRAAALTLTLSHGERGSVNLLAQREKGPVDFRAQRKRDPIDFLAPRGWVPVTGRLPRRCPRSAIRRRGNGRHGLACVEFAAVLPILLFVMLGVCELGRAVMVKETLSYAARTACRAGSAPLASNTTINNKINTILTANRLRYADATVTILVNGQAVNASTATANDKISVKVSMPYSKVAWTGSFLYLTRQSVESETVVMMRQG
jgi:Flp pilus assembly protein TadG